MKKIVALMMILGIMAGAWACAFTGSGYPAWDGSAAPQNSICGMFDGNALQLVFDSASEYSFMQDGLLTACFFAFDAAKQNYLEMFLVLPENIAAGDVLTAVDGHSNSSISLYEVHKDSESLYFAGQMMGVPYPGSAEYEIRIEDVQQKDGRLEVTGSLKSALCRVENERITDEILRLENVSFHFAITSAPQKPQATPDLKTTPKNAGDMAPPYPAFTLPPDYRVV